MKSEDLLELVGDADDRMIAEAKKHNFFKRCFLVLWIVGLLWVCVRQASWDCQETQRKTEMLLDSAVESARQTVRMSAEARRIAVTFDTKATLALLDAQGNVLAQTQEFLLLRDGKPQLALLGSLTEDERSALIEAAMTPGYEAPSWAPAYATDAFAPKYPYGSVVYPYPVVNRLPESQAVTAPVELQLEPTDAADVWQAALDGEAHDAWLPYLRSEEAEVDRLLELVQGEKPKQSLFRWEHFRMEPAPEGLGAATLAAYRCSYPLRETLRSEGGSLLIALFLVTFASAAIAAAVDTLWKKWKR